MKDNNVLINNRNSIHVEHLILGGLLSITILSGIILSSTIVNADNDSGTDTLNITVPVACTMSGNINTAHTATINNGTYSGASGSEYENGIGKTTLTTYCNDQNGFSIYAIGYTGDVAGNTTLVGTSVSGNSTIATGTATSGPTSSWSMKVTKVTDSSTSYTPANMSITNSFNDYHVVPDAYTKVAEYHAATGSSATDTILGAKVETTYAAFISSNQIADTYSGQVKYVMVHPYDGPAPIAPLADTDCPANSICYAPNADDIVGSMDSISETKITKSPTAGVQDKVSGGSSAANITSNSTITLIAPNYSRAGYGFAGWSTDFNATSSSIIYGPNQTITTATDGTGDADVSTSGLILYPVWIASAGNIQNFSCASSGLTQATYNSTTGKMEATLSSMTALKDQRDNNVYTVAKLADGKCWMTENLRLEAENSSNASLAQGYATSTTYGNFTGLANSEDDYFDNGATANSLYSIDGSTTNTIKGGSSAYYGYRFPRYNNNNTNIGGTNSAGTTLTPSYNASTNSVQWYGYGDYYTWPAAIADVSQYTVNNQSVTTTSLCPAGWRLPKGGDRNNEVNNEFWSLVVDGLNNGVKPANYDSSIIPYYTGSTEGTPISKTVRAFPNNFVYSGHFGAYVVGSGLGGFYWSSTASNTNNVYNSYYLSLNSKNLSPGTGSGYGYTGLSIRCISNS